MIIRSINLRNWECFRGDHALKLKKGVYAIVAEYSDDPEQSNAAGKTSILEAVNFALFGEHRHRYEDDWITRGEEEGDVGLNIDGTVIRRSRILGKSTQLVVEHDGETLKGDEAQLFIERHIGL